MGVANRKPAFSLVLEYLRHNTQRTASGNERIHALGESQVVFSVRADPRHFWRARRHNPTAYCNKEIVL